MRIVFTRQKDLNYQLGQIDYLRHIAGNGQKIPFVEPPPGEVEPAASLI